MWQLSFVVTYRNNLFHLQDTDTNSKQMVLRPFFLSFSWVHPFMGVYIFICPNGTDAYAWSRPRCGYGWPFFLSIRGKENGEDKIKSNET